jgi:hypothetical protein
VVYVALMKHITFGDKSLLVGDEAADALLEYAAFLTTAAQGDTVEMRAIGTDGDEVTASFLLGPGVTMMTESTHTTLAEPENAEAIAYMAAAQSEAAIRTVGHPLTDEVLPPLEDMSNFETRYDS